MDARSQVLDSALRLFAERGFDAVGVQEIVERAGVTKPTLYHHFKSKQGLLETLLDERLEPLSEALRVASDYQGDLPLTLERIVTALLDFATREPACYQLLLAMSYTPPENPAHQVAMTHLRRYYALFEHAFEAAVPGHGNLRGKAWRLAVTLLGITNSYLALIWEGSEDVTAQLVHAITTQFSHGIYA